MKVFGYEFNTKETVKLFRHKDLVIDDIALSRPTPSNARSNTLTHSSRPTSLPTLAREFSLNLPYKQINLSKEGVPIFRGDLELQEEQGLGDPVLVQRCVIIHKEDEGFGLQVAGDNPVFVQTVKPDGAAAKAGVLQGDRVLKVHGTVVTDLNHMDVVKMISSSGRFVSLTLLGRVPEYSKDSVDHMNNESATTLRHCMSNPHNHARPMSCPTPDDAFYIRDTSLHKVRDKTEITAPKPLNREELAKEDEKKAEWNRNRSFMISQMLDEEKKYFQELQYQQRKLHRPDEKSQTQINAARKRIKNLETQLAEINANNEMAQASTSISKRSSAPLDEFSLLTTVSPPQNASILEDLAQVGSYKTSGMHFISARQVDVIPMGDDEDDGPDDQAEMVAPLEPQGPFSNFADLKSRPAHLAVFLHYLISNSDPASLLFFLISDLYQTGNSKELRRWAYEIHSTFLVPGAPCRVLTIDREIVESIDCVLLSEADDITLRRLFAHARTKAIDDINDRLADFRTKRVLGLGPIYGDELLKEVEKGDKNDERRVADKTLMQHFDYFFSATPTPDFEQLHNREQALASALATVVKYVLQVRPNCNLHEKYLEKCPTFVSKDKSGKFKLSKVTSKKAVQIKGHQFLLQPVYNYTLCYICEKMLWGINSQGYFCSNCDVVLHKQCTGSLEETCYPASQRSKGTKRPHIRHHNKTPKSAFPSAEEDTAIFEEPEEDEEADKTTDLPSSPVGRDQSGAKCSPADSGYGGDSMTDKDRAIHRSQSMRTREEQLRQSKKASGEYNLQGRRAKSDVDVDDRSIALALNGNDRSDPNINNIITSSSEKSLPDPDEVQRMLAVSAGESDMDVESEKPDLTDKIEKSILDELPPTERKRQDVLLELIHTERSHVRNLRVLLMKFYTPLLVEQVISPDVVKLLFANLEEILTIHAKLSHALQSCRNKDGIVNDIGQAILSIIDLEEGSKFEKAVATFCQHQQYALDVLRSKMKKDGKLQTFLVEAESDQLCRRHQLKDMLPYEMQRLTKYPLLLDTIAKYTTDLTELALIKRCSQRGKEILAHVNEAKKNSENLRRLQDLQNRLDTSQFDKENHPMVHEYRKLDLRSHRLIHEGRLTWKVAKNKSVDLYVVLLEEVLVMLYDATNQNKLVLRFHDVSIGRFCPVVKLCSIMAREVAVDKKAFFLVCTSNVGPQILEFSTQTMAEKKIWFRTITEQVTICKELESEKERASQSAISSKEQDSAESTQVSESQSDEPSEDNRMSSSEEEGASERKRDSQRLQIISQPRLINPCEIEVTKPTVLQHAEPVLTDIERIRRSDKMLTVALSEKQMVMAHVFHADNPHQLEIMADEMACGNVTAKGSKELVMATIVQANRLLDLINQGMKVTEVKDGDSTCLDLVDPAESPAVSCFKLTGIAAPMMRHLTALMQSLEDTEIELHRTRQDLAHYKSMVPDDSGTHVTKCEEPLSDLGSSPSSVGSTSYHQHLGGRDNIPCPLVLSPMTPRLSQGPTSSEETLTESKVGTPQLKTPEGLEVSPTSLSCKLRSPSPRLSVDTATAQNRKGSTSSLNAIEKKPVRAQSPKAKPKVPGSKSAQKISMQSSPPAQRDVKAFATANVMAPPKTLGAKCPRTPSPMNAPRTPSPKNLCCVEDETKKVERRKQKRQRHTALTGANDPRATATSPE